MFAKKMLLLAVSSVFSFGVLAQNVTLDVAQTVAVNFISMKKGNNVQANPIVSQQHIQRGESGEPLLYIFNFEGGGFVIVSADKSVEPVLAYSTTNSFAINGENPAAKDIVDNYATGISYNIKENMLPTVELKNEWEQMEIGVFKKQKAGTGVEPLITSKWNQDKYYNELCPDTIMPSSMNAYDNRTPNGCVALAMAQIMYYHRTPRVGQGNHKYVCSGYAVLEEYFDKGNYNYEAMSDVATGYSHALAQLIYHLGVSVDMDYKSDGSGTGSYKVTESLPRYFFYKTPLQKYRTMYSDLDWIDLLKNDLDKGLPMYYSANRQGINGDMHAGHAFICDGYDNQDRFHFNFGWGGQSNGFYFLNAIGNASNPAQAYILNNAVIIGIEPLTEPIKSTGADTLTATYGSFTDGSSPRVNYAANTNRSWLISPQCAGSVTQITLKTAYFSTDANDEVTIYRGNTADPNNIVTVLSGDTDMTINVSASQAFITFTGSNAGKGFKFTYTSSITSSGSCPGSAPLPGQYIKDTAGTISVLGGYDANSTCYWALIPGNGAKWGINIKFTDFDLQDGDVVEIYKWNGTRTWGNINYKAHGIYRFTKENRPKKDSTYTIAPELANTGATFIYFKTDNDLCGTGFSLNWSATPYNNAIHETSIGLSNLSVYPNPATDIVRLQVETLQPETLQITFCDMVGRAVYATVLKGNDNQITQDIDISKFAKGVYMLQIVTSKGKITKKVVIQ